MKKTLGLLLSLVLFAAVLSVAVSAEIPSPVFGIDLDPDQTTFNAGDEFTLAPTLVENPGLVCFQHELHFDPDVLEYLPYTEEEIEDDDFKGYFGNHFTMVLNQLPQFAEQGWLIYNGARASDSKRVGDMVYLNFRVKTSAPVATTIYIEVLPSPNTRNLAGDPYTLNDPEIVLYLNGYTGEEEPDTYTLSFNANGEGVTGMPDALTEEEGTVVVLADIDAPEREGFDFLGWSTDTTEANIVSSVTLSDDIELFAIWEEAEVPFSPFGLSAATVSAGTTAVSPTTTVRLLLGINSLSYQRAGFIITGPEGEVELATTTVYTSVVADLATYSAVDDFNALYILAIDIENFPNDKFGVNFSFKGFAVDLEGNYIYEDTDTTTSVATLIG